MTTKTAPPQSKKAVEAIDAPVGKCGCCAFVQPDDRLKLVGECAQQLFCYYDLLMNSRKRYASARPSKTEISEPTLRRIVCQAAFAAETCLRIMLKVGLDSLNNLRDSGALLRSLAEPKGIPAEGLISTNVVPFVKQMVSVLPNEFPKARWGEIIVKLYQSREAAVRVRDGAYQVQFRRGDGSVVRSTYAVAPQSEAFGRVDAADLFGASQARCVLRTIGLLPGRWRRERQQLQEPKDGNGRMPRVAAVEGFRPVDLYSLFVHTFAAARDLMYVHVRDVQQLGIGGVQGADPAGLVLALIIGGAVAEILAVIYAEKCQTENIKSDTCTAAQIFAAIGTLGFSFVTDGTDNGTTVTFGSPEDPPMEVGEG